MPTSRTSSGPLLLSPSIFASRDLARLVLSTESRRSLSARRRGCRGRNHPARRVASRSSPARGGLFPRRADRGRAPCAARGPSPPGARDADAGPQGRPGAQPRLCCFAFDREARALVDRALAPPALRGVRRAGREIHVRQLGGPTERPLVRGAVRRGRYPRGPGGTACFVAPGGRAQPACPLGSRTPWTNASSRSCPTRGCRVDRCSGPADPRCDRIVICATPPGADAPAALSRRRRGARRRLMPRRVHRLRRRSDERAVGVARRRARRPRAGSDRKGRPPVSDGLPAASIDALRAAGPQVRIEAILQGGDEARPPSSPCQDELPFLWSTSPSCRLVRSA